MVQLDIARADVRERALRVVVFTGDAARFR